MAKKETSEKFKTMIGGQALIEGILMLGPDKSSVVVRSGGELKIRTEPRRLPKKHSVTRWPLIRGVVNFFRSMKMGVEALMYSADLFSDEEDDAEPVKQSRLDAWLEKKLSSEKAKGALVTFSVCLGLLFSVALFFVLPSLLGSAVRAWLTQNEFAVTLIEGVVRILIFLAYLFLVSRMNDMKRVFSYHGAEHKTIRCYEAGLPLTVENVRKQTRLHPRCGTSFLFVVMIVSILVFSLANPILRPIFPDVSNGFLNALIRVAMKLLLLPLVVGISYEFNRLVGRYDNWLTRVLSRPGMWLQYLTTREPDEGMMEVGIAALTEVLPEQEGSDRW